LGVGRLHGDPDVIDVDDDAINAVEDVGWGGMGEVESLPNRVLDQLLDLGGRHAFDQSREMRSSA
jgi:hypothetical protein